MPCDEAKEICVSRGLSQRRALAGRTTLGLLPGPLELEGPVMDDGDGTGPVAADHVA